MFNTAKQTFQILNNMIDINDIISGDITESNKGISLYESVNLSYTKSISGEGGFTVGNIWSGNGQTQTIVIVKKDHILAHTWHTLYIQTSKFDSYFGAPAPVLPVPSAESGYSV